MPDFPQEYIFQEYPKYLYHDNGAATIVQNAQEQKDLGGGWHEKISDLGVETCPASTAETTIGSATMPGFARAQPQEREEPSAPPANSGAGDTQQQRGPHPPASGSSESGSRSAAGGSQRRGSE